MNTLTSFDISILNFIRENLTSPGLDKFMTTITRLGDGGFIWIALTLVFLMIKEKRQFGKILALSLLTNVILVNLITKPLVARTRPYDWVEGISLIINKPGDFSFPSGHTSMSFAFVSVALFFSKSKAFKLASLTLAILIGFSRLYLYVHYPTDVFFGIVFGFLSGYYAKRAYEKGRFEKYFNKKIE